MKLNCELMKHQKKAVDKLIKLRVGALFMEQGTGKSVTALAIAMNRLERNKINKIIWLCPCSSRYNIKKEIVKQTDKELRSYIIVCGIETLSTSIRANVYLRELTASKECMLIIDESLLIKNQEAHRSSNIQILADKCKYKLLLNGTPISRNECDLFSQFYMLDWRILGYKSYWSFAANHIEKDEKGVLTRVLNADYLASKIAPYSYVVKKSECLELKDKIYRSFPFQMTQEQEEEYNKVSEKLLFKINEFRPETIYRLFTALQAVTCGKKIVFEKDKLNYTTEEMFNNENPRFIKLKEVLNNISGKCIIFCNYTSEIDFIVNSLKDCVRFDGNVNLKNRNKSLDEFKQSAKYFVANRNCAGYSLNLQFCNNIVYFSNNWDLGTRIQSEDRVHRIGQNKNVYIYDIYAENTIDEVIIKCLQKKESILNAISKEIKNKNSVELIEKIKGVK